MALNTTKCNYLTPLHFKQLNTAAILTDTQSLTYCQVISETIFPTNHLAGTSKQNQTTTKL